MKNKKLLLYGILALLAMLIAAFIFIGNYTDRLIDPYVRSLLDVTRPMGHKVDYGKIRVNLFQRSIILKNIKMAPDTSLPEGRTRYEIEVSEIRLTDFRIWDMLFKKSLIIQDFKIENPDVRVILPAKALDVINEVRERQEPEPELKKQLLTQIFLDRIVLTGGNFSLYRNDFLMAGSNQINFLAQSIHLVKNSLEEPIGYTYGEVDLSLSNIDIYSESGLYDMRLGFFEASKKDSSVTMKEFAMIPKYSKSEFSTKLDFQDDRFDLEIGRIDIVRVGLKRWLAGGPLIVSKILIDSIDADIYRDKNVKFDLDRFPLFYNESFLKIPVPLILDSLIINHSRILYGELAATHPAAGSILLDDFYLQSYDLTTQAEVDSVDNVMHFRIQAQVMGEGNMNVDLVLPLEGNLRKFRCSGSVGAMQLGPLNDMLEPSINIKFNGGRVDRMTFDFTANDHSSSGWMEFLYSDLDVSLVKKEPEKQWSFVSLLANTVTVSNNPVEGKDVKIVAIGYERNKNKGIINYVWKTIQSGMVRTIIPTKKYQINRKKTKKR